MSVAEDVARELGEVCVEMHDYSRSGGHFGAPTVKWTQRLEALALRLEGDEADEDLPAAERCAIEGHDYEVLVVVGSSAPANVVCTRCGEVWGIAR